MNMIKSTLYRQYAAECRGIADILCSGELRSQLLTIAAEWELLAADAAKKSMYQPYGDDTWFWAMR